jgi:hypothetical protein
METQNQPVKGFDEAAKKFAWSLFILPVMPVVNGQGYIQYKQRGNLIRLRW